MPCPGEGPCEPWDLDLSCCLVSGGFSDPCLGDGSPVPQVIVDQMILAASQFMWRKTGMQFGCCSPVIRPMCPNRCDNPCPDGGSGFPWTPVHLASGEWTNVTCPSKNNCACVEMCDVNLPYPVCSVDEVKVNGEVLDPSEYAVFDFKKLARLKSPQPISKQTEILTLQVGIDVPGDTFCFQPNPDADTDATETAPDSGCYTFDNSNPTWTWTSTDKIRATYNDPIGPEGSGSFRIRNVDHGDWDFPINSTPMTIGETRFSNKDVLTGDRIAITWLGPGPGPHVDVLNGPFIREGGGTFEVTNLAVQPGGCWPDCNNLTLADTELGTWSVKLTYGRPIPELVRLAAQELACQLIKQCVGKPCDLPKRVQNISRQGMSATFLDPMEFIGQGLTGILLVDLAIKTYNPKGLYKKAWVGSPDTLNQWKVQTWGDGDPIGPNCS